MRDYRRLSTIHFYIILKHSCFVPVIQKSLSTIHFYIILKLELHRISPVKV